MTSPAGKRQPAPLELAREARRLAQLRHAPQVRELQDRFATAPVRLDADAEHDPKEAA
jgi:hypothetical protein